MAAGPALNKHTPEFNPTGVFPQVNLTMGYRLGVGLAVEERFSIAKYRGIISTNVNEGNCMLGYGEPSVPSCPFLITEQTAVKWRLGNSEQA